MSILTIAQIKTEIRGALGNRTDLDTRLNPAINLAQQRLCRLKDFEELRSIVVINTAVTATIANDKVISLTTLGRYRKLYTIRLYATAARDRKLRKLNTKRWDQLLAKPEFYARGVPTHYHMWGKDQLELWRVPDAVYAMQFRISRWPNAAGADGDFLDLEDKDDLIILLSASYLAASTGNMGKASELYALYRAEAKDVLNEEEEDFDTFQAVHGSEMSNYAGRGYDDPFVHSIED